MGATKSARQKIDDDIRELLNSQEPLVSEAMASADPDRNTTGSIVLTIKFENKAATEKRDAERSVSCSVRTSLPTERRAPHKAVYKGGQMELL